MVNPTTALETMLGVGATEENHSLIVDWHRQRSNLMTIRVLISKNHKRELIEHLRQVSSSKTNDGLKL